MNYTAIQFKMQDFFLSKLRQKILFSHTAQIF
jgi:hypothetical protein